MTALSHASVPPPHALDEDYRLLKSAVEEAGKLAHSYFRQEVAVRRKKDGTEVSDADIAVNEALKETLLGGRPDYGWLSEESEDDATRLERRLVWMVDPIDGTNAFLRHIPEWTISAALVQEGKPVARRRVQSCDRRVLPRHSWSRRLPQRHADQGDRQGDARRCAVHRERRPVQEAHLEGALARRRNRAGSIRSPTGSPSSPRAGPTPPCRSPPNASGISRLAC